MLNTEKQIIDETTEVEDIDKTDDPSLEEQHLDTETGQEMPTEPADGDSLPDETGEDAQTEPESGETSTGEPPAKKPEPDVEYTRTLASVDQHLSKLEELFTSQIARNQNQKQMFDTIYREMKDYKENSLMEAFHKPIIHNLIQFYDNFVEVEAQLDDINSVIESLGSLFNDAFVEQRPKEAAEKLPQTWKALEGRIADFRNNMANVRFELVEVLYRIDVEPYEEEPSEKLDRKLHKTLETQPTDDPDQNQNVAEVHKIGFYWGEKVIRPAEVTILRYTPPANESEEVPSEESVSENATEEKGDKTDG